MHEFVQELWLACEYTSAAKMYDLYRSLQKNQAKRIKRALAAGRFVI